MYTGKFVTCTRQVQVWKRRFIAGNPRLYSCHARGRTMLCLYVCMIVHNVIPMLLFFLLLSQFTKFNKIVAKGMFLVDDAPDGFFALVVYLILLVEPSR